VLRIIILCIVIFLSYKYIDFEEHFDNTKPTIEISQILNNKKTLINNSKLIKTSLTEKKGILINVKDTESNLDSVEMFFKNKSTNNNYLRFYKKFKMGKNEINIDLNKTILNKSLFGTHLTTIKVVSTDNSFKKNKTTFDFKITNNVVLPFFEVTKQGFEPFIPNTVNWAIIKSNNIEISDISSNKPQNTIFKKINEYTYGILFFHTDTNIYDISISDIYGNSYTKKITFLKLKKNYTNNFNNKCFNVFKSLNIVDTNKRKNNFNFKYNYSQGQSFVEGNGLLKGECNNTPYIIYSTNLNKINFLSFGIDTTKATKKIKSNINLKSNQFIGDYILFNHNLFDVNSYVKSYMNLK